LAGELSLARPEFIFALLEISLELLQLVGRHGGRRGGWRRETNLGLREGTVGTDLL
jgi:hypothetical protein